MSTVSERQKPFFRGSEFVVMTTENWQDIDETIREHPDFSREG